MSPRRGWFHILRWLSIRSDFLFLPLALLEQDCAGDGHGAFGDGDGGEDTVGLHVQRDREPAGQRDFEEPEAEEVDDGGGDGVSRAVEGLHHDHEVSVAEVAVADDAQAGRAQGDDGGVVREQANDGGGEEDEDDADRAEEDHVVDAGAPHGLLGALGAACAKVLSDESCGGIAQAPRGQDYEDDDADADGVSGERGSAEDADDADQADPTGVGDGELKNAGEGDANQAQENVGLQANLAFQDAQALGAAHEAVELKFTP